MSERDICIIQALHKDDENAIKMIFKLYYNQLFFFTCEFVIDKEVAQEIIHDAIFRFWQHRHQIHADTNVKAYLLKIVRNLSLNYLKKNKRNPEVLLSSEEIKQDLTLNYEVLADSDWDKLLVDEMENILHQIIFHLPEKCKKVFELSRFEQLSNLEIASQLNISVKTVEGHITEALKTIRHKLFKYLAIIILTSIA